MIDNSAFTPDRLNILDASLARTTLNLGCGRKHVAHAVNVDRTDRTTPDIVHDLNQMPWPFRDNEFREVLMFDILEHLDNVVAVMEEIYRVSRPGAIARITVPHYSCANAFTDPTHVHQLGCHSFDYFIEGHENSYYSLARFKLCSRTLYFYPSLLNKFVRRLANRWPSQYERRWAWLFPAWYISFELEVVKGSPIVN